MPAQRVVLTRDVMEHAIKHGWSARKVCRRYRVTQSAVLYAERRYGLNLLRRNGRG
jgi:hypothetical protein